VDGMNDSCGDRCTRVDSARITAALSINRDFETLVKQWTVSKDITDSEKCQATTKPLKSELSLH
jgi:hypothetical protein